MNIVTLDIGNYRTKLALISGDNEIIRHDYFLTTEIPRQIDRLQKVITEYNTEALSIGCVVPEIEVLLSKALSKHDPLFVHGDTKTELVVEYSPPESLGADRLSAAVGAYREYGRMLGRDIMIVDAGTTVTADIVSSGGVFIGGAILPGDQIALRALAESAKKLPPISFETREIVIGSSTRECMLIGVQATIIGAVEHLYHRYGGIHGENPFIILTGASASWLAPGLNIPNMIDPDLVLFGLAAIWSYNRE